MFKFSCANAIPRNLYFCLFERVEIFFLAYSAFFCIEKEKFSRKNLFFFCKSQRESKTCSKPIVTNTF